jgi:hypothetical protein
MEIEKLISALQEAISFLHNSQSSDWANMSVENIIQELESEIVKAKNSQPIDSKLLSILFAPTGAIQETSIDNGWGDELLRISELIDQYTLNS